MPNGKKQKESRERRHRGRGKAHAQRMIRKSFQPPPSEMMTDFATITAGGGERKGERRMEEGGVADAGALRMATATP